MISGDHKIRIKTNLILEVTLDNLARNSPFFACSHPRPKDKIKEFASLTSPFGLHQLINEPTHILKNLSSYIDLISTSQHSLVVNSRVSSSYSGLYSSSNCICKVWFTNILSPTIRMWSLVLQRCWCSSFQMCT